MAKLLMPKEIYRSLLDSFFLAASVNCNAYLEFRVQGGIIRTKFSDTEKPGHKLLPEPNFSKPPPSFRPHVSSGRTKEPQKKRLHAEIATPSPPKPASNLKVAKKPIHSDANNDGNEASAVPDPPELLRESEPSHHVTDISALSFDNAYDDVNEADYTTYDCDFFSPNRYGILNQISEDLESECDNTPVISSPITATTTVTTSTATDMDRIKRYMPICEECHHECTSCNVCGVDILTKDNHCSK